MSEPDQEARLKYYRRFTDERNKALERIKDKYEAQINDELRKAFTVMADVFLSGKHQSMIKYVIHDTSNKIYDLIIKMRHAVYVLTVASEGEILARVTNRNTQKIVTHKVHSIMHKESPAGGEWTRRITYYLNRIVKKLEAITELANVTGVPVTAEEIKVAFPKIKGLRRNVDLMRLAEALKSNDDEEDQPDITFSDTSEIEWDTIYNDYLNEYVPQNRGPDSYWSDDDMLNAGRFPGGRYEGRTYEWELESDITEDFVQTVRDGQVDAANQNGIVDFVWIAVLDNRTDDCCIWRNGLTTSEIQEQLKGPRSGDECQGSTPPIHFNCRCSLEPSTDDLPDQPISNKGSFDEWLDS